jgi:predicted small lipoprotein YifL
MRALIILMTILFAVSACGKKAPLRPPEEPPEQSLR